VEPLSTQARIQIDSILSATMLGAQSGPDEMTVRKIILDEGVAWNKIFTANLFGSSDAFINPAFTLGFTVKTGAFNKMLPYLAAQVGGAFAGAVVVWLFYWRATEDPAVKLGVFCTGPAIRSYGANLISEIIGTSFWLQSPVQ
jgi:glycerol uptake facilitator-like aquaporin